MKKTACIECKKTIVFHEMYEGKLEIKCRHCKRLNLIVCYQGGCYSQENCTKNKYML